MDHGLRRRQAGRSAARSRRAASGSLGGATPSVPTTPAAHAAAQPNASAVTPTPQAGTLGGTTTIPPTNLGGATSPSADGATIASVAPLTGGAFARAGGVETSTGPNGAKIATGAVAPLAPSGNPSRGGQNPSGGAVTPTPVS